MGDLVIEDWRAWVAYVRQHPGRALQVQWERAGERYSQTLIPQAVEEGGEKVGRVGMGVQTYHYPDELLREIQRIAAGPLSISSNPRDDWFERMVGMR